MRIKKLEYNRIVLSSEIPQNAVGITAVPREDLEAIAAAVYEVADHGLVGPS